VNLTWLSDQTGVAETALPTLRRRAANAVSLETFLRSLQPPHFVTVYRVVFS